MKRTLRLLNKLSPGDVVMLTAAVRDLHRSHPDKFQTWVQTSAGSLWDNNPLIKPLPTADAEIEDIHCAYPLIHRSNRTPHHFIHGFMQDLGDKLGVKIEPTEFKGDIHLSEDEQRWMSQVQEITRMPVPFWIIGAGGATSYTAIRADVTSTTVLSFSGNTAITWTPSSNNAAEVMNGLVAWQRADRHVMVDSSNQVTIWGGADGCLPDAQRVTYAGPVLQTVSLGQQPVVAFGGTEGLRLLAGELGNDNFTLVVVACSDTLNDWGSLFGPDNSQSGAVAGVAVNAGQVKLIESGGGGYARLSAETPGCLCPLTIIYENKQARLYWLGNLVTQDSSTPPYTVWLPKLIGGTGSGGFAGRLAEVLFYNRALSDYERQQVEAYLVNRYQCLPSLSSETSSEMSSEMSSGEPSWESSSSSSSSSSFSSEQSDEESSESSGSESSESSGGSIYFLNNPIYLTNPLADDFAALSAAFVNTYPQQVASIEFEESGGTALAAVDGGDQMSSDFAMAATSEATASDEPGLFFKLENLTPESAALKALLIGPETGLGVPSNQLQSHFQRQPRRIDCNCNPWSANEEDFHRGGDTQCERVQPWG